MGDRGIPWILIVENWGNFQGGRSDSTKNEREDGVGTMNTVRVHVSAGEGVEDARRAVQDVLEMLNRHFRARGVEFVTAGEGKGDWTIALYWKDFGGMGRDEFEKVYEGFRKEKKPVIHVFFKEPDEGIAEALKAFKDAFAEKYGHFYCHFETVDAVRFQLVSQGLWLLPGTGSLGERDALKVEDGVVRLGNEPVAKMENLSFAKLNARRKSLLRKIADAEKRVEELEEDAATSDDEEMKDLLRDARMERHNLKEELKQHDGFLFNVAVEFAKTMAEETSERTRQAWKLFQQGKVQEANRLLDWNVLKESTERNRRLFQTQREAFEKNLQEYLAKAKIVMADDSMTMTERVDEASRAYDEAVAIAREIHWDDEQLARVLVTYAYLLSDMNRNGASIKLYEEALAIWRQLEKAQPVSYLALQAMTLNNLAAMRGEAGGLEKAEREYKEALKIRRELASTQPDIYEAAVAQTLNNLAVLHQKQKRLSEAETEYTEALNIWRFLISIHVGTNKSDMALILNNLASLHASVHQLEEAEHEYQESLEIRRGLATMCPAKYEKDVAQTLNNIAGFYLLNPQQIVEAEQYYAEALEIYRRLAADNPEAHEEDAVRILQNLAVLYSHTQRLVEAEKSYEEALMIQRRLTATQPRISNQVEEARMLYNLANLHLQTQRLSLAEKEYGEALAMLRKVIDINPAMYGDILVKVLDSLAILHSATQRPEEAEAEFKEALAILRRLSATQPNVYDGIMAQILNSIGLFHCSTHRLAEAEREQGEALEIYRRLSSMCPEAYQAELSLTLHGLGLLHSAMNQVTTAEREFKEAIAIRRRLAMVHPEIWERDLALTLHALAELHSDIHQLAVAEEEYQEALGILRRLAATNPAEHEMNEAMVLCNLAELKRKIGAEEQARRLAGEGVEIYKRCETREPRMFEDKVRWAEGILGNTAES